MDKFLFVHGGPDDPMTSATDKQGLSVPPNHSARLTLLRWATGHGGNDIIPKHAGGLTL